MKNKDQIILLGLNEINFHFILTYIKMGLLPNFKFLFEKYKIIKTVSEKQYELLEPWIQWPTIYTGKEYKDHKLFRLGDILNRNDLKQIFEELEDSGFSVGVVSPFNADNRLKNPSFLFGSLD